MTNVDLEQLRTELQAELKLEAERGDIHACDVIHGYIADIETVMQLAADRAERGDDDSWERARRI